MIELRVGIMKSVRLDFTYDSWQGCRDKPTVKLVSALMELGPGDEIVIEGEDTVMPINIVTDTLMDECFDIDIEERDNIIGYYRIRGVKRECSG